MKVDEEQQREVLVERYAQLAVQREQLESDIRSVLIDLQWRADPLVGTLPAAKQHLHQADLLGFVKVCMGLMDVSHQRALFGNVIANGGGPEKPERPERPERPESTPRELIDRDRATSDRVIREISSSNLSPADKQRAIENIERHHQECIGNASKCLL
jgi:hypothetical protein